MKWSIEQTVAPTSEPVTTAEAKSHLYVSTADDDVYIAELIAAGRTYAEAVTSRQFMSATYVLYLDDFWGARRVNIPRPPLSSISSIVYIDTDGNSQTWSSSKYVVDANHLPGTVELAEGESWPSVKPNTYNAVQITFVAGYASAALVPSTVKHAIKAFAGTMYAYREDVITGGSKSHVGEVADRFLSSHVSVFEAPWQ